MERVGRAVTTSRAAGVVVASVMLAVGEPQRLRQAAVVLVVVSVRTRARGCSVESLNARAPVCYYFVGGFNVMSTRHYFLLVRLPER